MTRPQPVCEPANRSARTAALWVAGVAIFAVFVVRVWMARQIHYCGTPDSCSYLALASSLSRHQGFVENFLYQYQMVDVRLPQHGVEYWRPGTSFFFLLAQPFGGVTLFRSLVLTSLAGIMLAAAAWYTVAKRSADYQAAALAAVLATVLPIVWENSLTPDSSLFYGAAVAWFLLLFRAEVPSWKADLLAWAALVVVNLLRNDAILLLPSVLTILFLRRRQASPTRAGWIYPVIVLLGFFAAMLPNSLTARAVLGHSSASHTLQALYVVNLSDLIAYHQPLSFSALLAAGVGKLIRMRIVTPVTIVYRWIFVLTGFGTVLLTGLVLRGRRRFATMVSGRQPGAVFALTTLAVYGLVIPAIGSFSALRTFNGLVPLVAACMVAGLLALCSDRRAALALGWTAVLFYTVSGITQSRRSIDAMNDAARQTEAVRDYLDAHGGSSQGDRLVMTPDPAQFSETTSYPAVPVPSNGISHIAEAVHDLRPAFVLISVDPTQSGQSAAATVSALHPARAEVVPGTTTLVLTMSAPQTSGVQ